MHQSPRGTKTWAPRGVGLSDAKPESFCPGQSSFQSYETLYTVSLVIHSIMIGVSLTLFFMSIWSIHDALVGAQQRELTVVREHWGRARSELKRKLAQCAAGEPAGLYEPMVVLGE